MTGVQTCALPICFPVTIRGFMFVNFARLCEKNGFKLGFRLGLECEFVEFCFGCWWIGSAVVVW